MLALVFPNGHEVGAVEQDVGRHQDRIGEEPGTDPFGILPVGFVLELGHPLKPSHRGDAAQNPG